jgi:thymidine phosphorylase
VCHAKRGHEVTAGQVLAEVHARTEAAADEAAGEVLAAYELGPEPPPERRILLEVLTH